MTHITKQYVTMWTALSYSRYGRVWSLCEHVNEPSLSLKTDIVWGTMTFWRLDILHGICKFMVLCCGGFLIVGQLCGEGRFSYGVSSIQHIWSPTTKQTIVLLQCASVLCPPPLQPLSGWSEPVQATRAAGSWWCIATHSTQQCFKWGSNWQPQGHVS